MSCFFIFCFSAHHVALRAVGTGTKTGVVWHNVTVPYKTGGCDITSQYLISIKDTKVKGGWAATLPAFFFSREDSKGTHHQKKISLEI